MKVIILAGGRGSRLGGLTDDCPKPMIKIGSRPILGHIFEIFQPSEKFEFIVATGYLGEQIAQWIRDCTTQEKSIADLRVCAVETGQHTGTGGRLLELREWIGNETFMMTYGDGLIDIDVSALINFHLAHGKMATVTAVQPPPRYGRLEMDGEEVTSFEEKKRGIDGWINGGFFVLEPQVLDYIEGAESSWEGAPLQNLASQGQLMAFKNPSFWKGIDTEDDLKEMEDLWQSGLAPWVASVSK